MKKLLSFLILSLVFLTAKGQSASSYVKYHEAVIKAEESASVQEFEKALAIYTDLFSRYDFIFLRDCKVAAQLAAYLGSEEKAFSCLRLGIAHGWEIRQIRKNKLLKPLHKKAEWKVLQAQADSLRQVYQRRLRPHLQAEVRQMFRKDQRLAIGALFRIGAKAQDRYAEQKFAPNSRQQLTRLDRMLEKEGYPGERLIGNSYWMETILSHSNSISKEHVQKDTLYQYLKPKLLLALRGGEISPYEFALIENWKISVGSGWTKTSYGYLSAGLREAELQQANYLRSQLGLRSVETRNRLIDVQQQTGINFWLPGWPAENGKIKLLAP